MPRPSQRDRILAAAGVVVRRDGSDALTLDAVAAEAGVSKGGLLYHFASKEALVEGLVGALVAGFDRRLAQLEDGRPGSFTRAYLHATVEGEVPDRTSAALLAAVALAPHLLEPLRERYRAWAERLDRDGICRVDALVVRLAVDGLWMAELLGLDAPPPERRAEVIRRLQQLTEGRGP
ncbi:TetR/AcrR family transcriptional regulator [Sorangium sp. So ce1078]|uniref:TetR/AcrR family transcriptional regulator n=1 Tax=Sorangium sp. So ce1078 TaxID=3133329 RepID=UPI003F64356E